jgi:lipopolysaccharide biosynthesis glycosyltransferase
MSKIVIVTAKRPNSVTYLYNTLDSLLQNAAKEDKKDIYIIILLADFDDDWRRKFNIVINCYNVIFKM